MLTEDEKADPEVSLDEPEVEASTEKVEEKEEKTEEAEAEQKVEGEEKKEGEEEEEAKVETPELTDDQVAHLRETDARFKTEPSALDQLVKDAMAEEKRAETEEKEQADTRATWDQAEKAWVEDKDPEPLATLAQKGLREARERAALQPEVDAAVRTELGEATRAVYGDVIDSMSKEDLVALDKLPLKDAYAELDRRRSGTSKSDASAVLEKAKQSTKTAVKAREEAGGVIPGGSAEEGQLGDDLDVLLEQTVEGINEDIAAREGS